RPLSLTHRSTAGGGMLQIVALTPGQDWPPIAALKEAAADVERWKDVFFADKPPLNANNDLADAVEEIKLPAESMKRYEGWAEGAIVSRKNLIDHIRGWILDHYREYPELPLIELVHILYRRLEA